MKDKMSVQKTKRKQVVENKRFEKGQEMLDMRVLS